MHETASLLHWFAPSLRRMPATPDTIELPGIAAIVDVDNAPYRELRPLNVTRLETMQRKPIVERVFQAAGKDLACRLFAPVAEETGFRCSYEISSFDSQAERGDAMGEDGVQALLNAMAKVRTKLEAWPTRVTWLGSEHLGLPGLDSVLNEFTPEGRWFSHQEKG